MKRNSNFLLKEMAGNFVLVPFGEYAIDFNGIVTLNETAKFMWEFSEEEINKEKLIPALVDRYEIDTATAEKAFETWVQQMKEVGCIE